MFFSKEGPAENSIQVILFYKFVNISNINDFANNIEMEIMKRNILGRLLVAPDGLNGTLAGKRNDILDFETYCVDHAVKIITTIYMR